MSGGAAVQCLPCGKKLVVKEMSSHIHEHVHYYPQNCNDCDFRCVNKSDLDLHTYETDHTGSVCFDPYKQWLVDTINDDSCFAAKFGVDELLKRKNITAPPRTPSTQPSPVVTPAQQQRQTPIVRRVVSPPPRLVETSSDSDDEPQQVAAKPKAPAVPVKRNSGVQNRRPEPPAKEKSSSDESEDSDDEEIVKLRQELTKNVKCSLCKETVRISISARQSHVKENHMDGFTNGQPSEARKLYFLNELEKRTKDAFPNLVWTSLQCPKCPKMRDIKSFSGRISHVYNAHHMYLQRLGCPKAPCQFKTFDPSEFKKHFMESHGSVSNWKLFLGHTKLEREFPAKYADHRRKIEAVSRLLFPMDIPQHILESAKKKRKSGGDDDDNDILELSALIAAAPSKPAGPRVAQKRRRSPSAESSSDSDADKPTGSKKAPADKEEEGTGRETDQDSSHNSSGATVAGETTNSNGAKNGEREVKQEAEIKQEPPATPTVLSSVPRFTGRPVPPSSSPNPFPTAEQGRQLRLKAEQLRNNGARVGHDGGRSAGYGGSMRGGRGGGNVGRGRAGFNTPSGGGGRGRRFY